MSTTRSALQLLQDLIEEIENLPVIPERHTLLPEDELKPDYLGEIKLVTSLREVKDDELKKIFQECYTKEKKRHSPDRHNIIHNNKKNAVEEIKKRNISIRKALELPNFESYLPFIYFMLRAHIELEIKPDHCMLCLKDKKSRGNTRIADSHYISRKVLEYLTKISHLNSRFYVQPSSNSILSPEKVTLPLFCTGSSKNSKACEQKLSDEGETPFASNFLPFLDKIREAVSSGSNQTFSLKYDSWLFYMIVSLAFRLMLVELRDDFSDNLLSFSEDSSEEKSKQPFIHYWELFSFCREFLLQKNRPKNLYVGIYFSNEGLLSTNGVGDNHPPIVDIVVYRNNHNDLELPCVVYGIAGAYFIVATRSILLHTIEQGMPPTAFYDKIDPVRGEIIIDLSKTELLTPSLVNDAILKRKLTNQEGALKTNPKIVIDQLVKFDSKNETNILSHFAAAGNYNAIMPQLSQTKTRIIIQLPDGLRFKLGQEALGKLSKRGYISVDNPKYFPLEHNIPGWEEMKGESWLIEYKPDKNKFAVVHIENKSGGHVVVAYDFKFPTKIELFQSYPSGALHVLINLMSPKPRIGTDHSLFKFHTKEIEQEQVTIMIVYLLMSFYDKNNENKDIINPAAVLPAITHGIPNFSPTVSSKKKDKKENKMLPSKIFNEEKETECLQQHSGDMRITSLIYASLFRGWTSKNLPSDLTREMRLQIEEARQKFVMK